MSASDGAGGRDDEGPGGPPKPPASGTLAGMPPARDPSSTGPVSGPVSGPGAPQAHARAPLPPPKAPPGGRASSSTMPPPGGRASSSTTPPRGGRASSSTTPPPSGRAPSPTSPPYRRDLSGVGPLPQAQPPAPSPGSAPHPLPQPPAPSPASAPHALPPQPSAPTQLGAWGPPPGAPPPYAAHAHAPPPYAAAPGGPPGPTQHGLGAFGGRPLHAGDSMEEVPGSQFVKFLKISSRRAFRLRIEPREVLPSERASLEAASPPITDPNLQAFLAWRRSVLFLVAVALVPLSIIGLVDAMAGSMPGPIRIVKLAPALAEGLFCWLCWDQLKRWSHWRTQRRKLFWGWILFMATPFVVFLYPLRTVLVESASNPLDTLRALGVDGTYRRAVMPFVFAMIAMLQLAPKAISLMPGLIRASLVIKLQFPGSTAPGWLIVMCAPLYALLAYVILVIPYQFTGSGWFIAGVLGVIAGQAVLARAGFALARPLSEDEALRAIRRVRNYYIAVMVISAVLIVIALASLIDQLNMRATDVITAVMKFETNVLILTMIGADLVVTNLDRARQQTVGKGHVEEEAEVKIAAFVSLDAPSTPPPTGPAT